jgi:hypothetical protein
MTIAKPLQRLLKPIALASVLIALTACGGGGGGGSDVPAAAPPTETNFFAQGIYAGDATDLSGSTDEMVVIVSADGSFDAINTYDASVSYGVLTSSTENSASGPIRSIAGPGLVWAANNEKVIDAEVFLSQSAADLSISGSTSYQDVTQSNFLLDNLQDVYDNPPPSLAEIAGTYSAYINFVDVFISISSSGAVSGYATTGCQYSAQLQQAIAGKNLYNFNLSVSSCGDEDGNYVGKSFFFLDDSLLKFALIGHNDNNGSGGIFSFVFE